MPDRFYIIDVTPADPPTVKPEYKDEAEAVADHARIAARFPDRVFSIRRVSDAGRVDDIAVDAVETAPGVEAVSTGLPEPPRGR